MALAAVVVGASAFAAGTGLVTGHLAAVDRLDRAARVGDLDLFIAQVQRPLAGPVAAFQDAYGVTLVTEHTARDLSMLLGALTTGWFVMELDAALGGLAEWSMVRMLFGLARPWIQVHEPEMVPLLERALPLLPRTDDQGLRERLLDDSRERLIAAVKQAFRRPPVTETVE